MVIMAPATVEIHTLLAHRHVDRYLVALHSLLRFWDGPDFVIHDDGSLDGADRQRLTSSAPRVRIVDAAVAEEAVNRELAAFPLVRKVRQHNLWLKALIDYYVLAEADRVIGMDSDIVFLRRPDKVIEWAEHGGWSFGYSPEHGWQPKGIHWLPDAVPGHPFIADMCAGFVCAEVSRFFDPAALDLLMRDTDPDILYQIRFVSQMLHSLMGGRLDPHEIHNLGEPYRSGRLEWLPSIPDRVLCHYFGSHDDRDALGELLRSHPDLRVAAPG
jgi:hypothetical protein